MALFNFLRKNTSSERPSEDPESMVPIAQKQHISGTKRDYDAFDNNDITLKFWLPEVMDTILEEMCIFTNTTRSDLIRQTLFTYLYGRYDLMSMIEKGDMRFALSSPVQYSVTSLKENRTRELGKNTQDIKVSIPGQMKSDLQSLADTTKITLSHFIREILISNLLGHSYLPEREELQAFKIEIEDS